MKNLIHSVASICLVIWLIGFFMYKQTGYFHLFLAGAIVAAGLVLLMETYATRQKKNAVKTQN